MVTFSESFKKFLEEERDKGSKLAGLITRTLYWHTEYPMYRKVLTTSEIDYITMRPDGMISYLPAGKQHKTNDRGEWSRDGRQSGKAGKVIRKIFTEEILRFIPAIEFETFGNAYKAKFMNNGFKFELKPRTEVDGVYGMRRASGESSLSGSCMNGDSYMDIYECCKQLQILIMTNKEKELCGRAFVWQLNHENHGDITFMDRIYVAEDYMYDIFLNHAKENGWWRKSTYRKYEDRTVWVNPETDKNETMKVRIELDTDHSRYPYIDTFSYGGDGWLENHTGSDYDYTYNKTNGSREGDGSNEEDNHDGESWDEIAEQYIDESDAVYLSSRGDREYRDRTTHIHNCVEAYVGNRRNTEWFHEDDTHVVKIGSDWYHIHHNEIVRRADGEYDLEENCVYCETDSEYYESDDSDLIRTEGGEYRHKMDDDDVIYIEDADGDSQGTYHYRPDVEDDIVTLVNGEIHWKKATCIKKVEYHEGAVCSKVWALKIDLLKYRNKIYYKDDIRITNKVTREAYPMI